MVNDRELTEDQVKNMSDLLLYSMTQHYDEQIRTRQRAGKVLGLIVDRGYVYLVPVFDLNRMEERDFVAMMIHKVNPSAFARGTKMETEGGIKTLEILTVDPYQTRLFTHPIYIDDEGKVTQREEDEGEIRDLKPGEFYPYRDAHIYSRTVHNNPERSLSDGKFEVFYSTLGGAATTYDYRDDWDRLVIKRERLTPN